MSTQTILLFAIGVFVLLAIGLVLTMIEFNRISSEPSERKGTRASIDSPAAGRRASEPRGRLHDGADAA